VIPVTLAPASKTAAKSSQSTKSKTSKVAKKPAPVKKVVTPKKSGPKKAVQAKPAAPAQDKPSTTFANKVVTVECTNGKKSTKVTSAKPMCPAGYWRK
jgi:hypothetical protein